MSGHQTIITKYRPAEFDQVMGHTSIISSLQRAVTSDLRPHCYLFAGPSGVGKTTLARIVGAAIGAEINEIDAASHSGVDDMRELVEASQYRSFQADGAKLFLIDECHTLSKSAWQALLKLTEEPPEHFYVALCTTEINKVPAAIVDQRAYTVRLKALSDGDIYDFLEVICDMEGWTPKPDVFTAVVQSAEGSPRKALTLMHSVHDAASRDEVSRVINLMDASEPVIELAQLLLKGDTNWSKLQPILAKIEDDKYDSAGIIIGRYLLGAMLKTNNGSQAQKIYSFLNALTFPTETNDPKLRFFVALGRLIWG